MKPFKLVVATTALILSSNVTAHLESRLGGLAYYNDEADLTWLADANAGGFMPWNNARSWVEGLDVNGVTDWRLPNSLQPDSACSSQLSGGGTYGTNCTGSELDNLFYNVLGGVAYTSIETTNNNNYNLFSNIQPDFYWTATEFPGGNGFMTRFDFRTGFQNGANIGISQGAWAVQSGDVGEVPVPAAIWLFGSGMLALAVMSRCKTRVWFP